MRAPAASEGAGAQQVLVLGGTGYLGSRLVRALLAGGHKVAVVKRASSDVSRLESLTGTTFYDIEDTGVPGVFERLGRVDVVIHAAGAYGRGRETLGDLLYANTALPLGVLEAAAASGTSLFLSSGTSLSPTLNGYALSKQQLSDWGRLVATDSVRLTFADVRIEHFYGPGDDDIKFATHLARALLRHDPVYPLTRGEQERDFIFIDDVISAYLTLVEKAHDLGPGYRAFPLGSGRPVTIRHFVQLMCRLSGSRTRLDYGALEYRPHEVMHSCADVAALEELGWRPCVTLEDGVARLLDDERARLSGMVARG